VSGNIFYPFFLDKKGKKKSPRLAGLVNRLNRVGKLGQATFPSIRTIDQKLLHHFVRNEPK